jgi:natural resistance-associated macrophage protein
MFGWWVPVEIFEKGHGYATVQSVGILGAVIMPHNLYLHSALVQSRKIDYSNKRCIEEANYYNAIESTISLAVAFLINLAVVSVFSEGFFDSECAEKGYNHESLNLACVDGSLSEFSDVTTYPQYASQACKDRFTQGVCAEIGLEVAGDALTPILQSSGKYFWAIGLLAAGQASTMTGTFAGQYVMEGFLDIRLSIWKRVLLTRCVALGPAVIVALATSHNSGESDRIGEWLNILQSIQLPFALIPLLLFTSSERIMGSFKNGPVIKVIVWSLSGMVLGTNIFLIYSFMFDPDSPVPHVTWFYCIVGLLLFVYAMFICFLLKDSVRNLAKMVTNNGPSITAPLIEPEQRKNANSGQTVPDR